MNGLVQMCAVCGEQHNSAAIGQEPPGLCCMALERIENGQLPHASATRTWGGRARGDHRCALCDKPIQAHEYEFEAQASTEDAAKLVFFHMACRSAWESACARKQAASLGSDR